MKIIILTKILFLVFFIKQFKFSDLEIQNFNCIKNDKSLSIDLKKKNEKKFSISFWIKISQKKPQILFSFENLIKQINIEINNNNYITLNKESSDIKIITNENKKNWNFILIFIDISNNKKLNLNFSINGKEFQKTNNLITKKNFLLILGSNDKNSICKTPLKFHSVIFYNQKNKFTNPINISLEKAVPIFLSKFSKEPSYNKFYENLIPNSYGPIINGFKKNSFNLFTNISSSNNKLGVKYHLINDLSVYLLPKFLLDSDKVNQSYIFFMQFDFYVKNYFDISNDNKYYHVLYQRYSKKNNRILLRSDLEVFFSKNKNEFSQRNFVGDEKKYFDFKKLTLKKDNSMEKVFINFMMVKVYQNPLFEKPMVEFKNGIDLGEKKKKNIFEIDLKMESSDKHFFGDSEKRDTTRKEFLSFINIKEITFYRGGYMKEKFFSNDYIFFSGFEKPEFLIYCSKTNDLNRGKGNNLILNKCEKEEIKCKIKNCDICVNEKCEICKPGYELRKLNCEKCKIEEGYDPILKKCYKGLKINEFFETQYSNLNSSLLDVNTLNLYFLVTAKLKIIPENFLNNGFIFFLNDIQDFNRVTDVCWNDCEEKDFSIYYGFQNTNIDQKINKLIIGNTSKYSIVPETFIIKFQNPSDFTTSKLKYKNFDCSFIKKILYLKKNKYFGKCISKCPTGTYLDHNINRCLNCKKNCLNCSHPEKCLKCSKGYTLTKNRCEKCQFPCKECKLTVNHCLSCANKNKLNLKRNNCENKCRKKNCMICDHDDNCLNCEKGFLLEKGICKKIFCKIENCFKCKDFGSCFECEKGFVLENRECGVCREHCSECPLDYYLDQFMKCVRKKKGEVFLKTTVFEGKKGVWRFVFFFGLFLNFF